ncbi:MAG: GNAT family N-acetyltransferase [Spartobacteria bacterium]|nr:GNAT family N-acetyltransferase [Spartobacteria bacterium]
MANDMAGKKWGLITLPNDVAITPALLKYAEQIARQAGFSSKAMHEIEIALEEACVDVINNAFAPNEEATYEVAFYGRKDGLEIRIHDMGLPYDPNLAPTYDPAKDLIDQDAAGLGTFLINNLVDGYQFNNLGKQGKEVRLLKYFDTPCIAEESPPVEPEIAQPPEKSEIEPVHFNIRLMKPGEALEVCRCIYDSYGYSYANENIYYPERVAAMNENRQLRSAVAVTDAGEMGGHFAMIYYEDLPAEVGIAVTKKKFRGQGFARQLGEFLAEEAMRDGLRGLQIKEVTAHPYTQKFCRKLGYKDCGILLAHSPKSLSFKGIADKLRQRNSDVLGFKYLQEPKAVTIYPPPRHREMILELYESIGGEVRCAETDDPAPKSAQSVMKVEVHAIRLLAVIYVVEYGPDFLQALRQELRKLFRDEMQVVELYIPLEDPLTARLVPELEKIGFMFTGILPETAKGHALVMQYFNGVHIDYNELVIVSDTAMHLLEYIRAGDPNAN